MKRSLPILLASIPWILATAGIAWIVIHRFPPSGTIEFDVPMDGTSAWVNPFLPSQRVTPPGDQGGWRGQKIIGDPVYATARVPGIYDSVDVTVEYKTEGQPLLELGVARNADASNTEFHPLWFAPLSIPAWRPTSWNGIDGYVYSSTPPSALASSDPTSIATWLASSTRPTFSDPASTSTASIKVSLRGSIDIWAIPVDGKISFDFDLQDSNRTEGRDAVVIQVSNGDRIIQTNAIGISGSRDTSMGPVVHQEISLDHLSAGVYRIQITMSDNVFIRSITTPCAHWVIGPRIVFGDNVGYTTSTPSITAWSNSRHLVLETFHREGLQTVRFGMNTTTLAETHQTVLLDRSDSRTQPQKLEAPYSDLRIVGDGYFSLRQNAFFVPQPRRVTASMQPQQEGIYAIASPYERPAVFDDGWMSSTIHFTIEPSQDIIRFVLSAPGIQSGSSVDIRRIRLKYHRPPYRLNEWVHLIRQEMVNAWRRISR
ncbi:MAG: hypothetical protein WC477_01010 [Patescibacteria group bacterium]